MLKSGAVGYLLRDCASRSLQGLYEIVADDKTYLSPAISGVVIEDYLHRLNTTEFTGPDILTDREKEVVQLMAEGKSTKQIAQNCISASKPSKRTAAIMRSSIFIMLLN